jgi:hypothetical protein
MANELGCPILQNINTPVAPFASVPVARNVFVSQTILDRFGSAAPSQVIHPGIDLALFSPPKHSILLPTTRSAWCIACSLTS